MSGDDIAKVAAPLAWPVVALLLAGFFYKPVCALLKRLAETLTFKSVKVKALGVEGELTPEYARTVLHELLDDITATSNQLTQRRSRFSIGFSALRARRPCLILSPALPEISERMKSQRSFLVVSRLPL